MFCPDHRYLQASKVPYGLRFCYTGSHAGETARVGKWTINGLVVAELQVTESYLSGIFTADSLTHMHSNVILHVTTLD